MSDSKNEVWKKEMRVRLDINNMFSDRTGDQGIKKSRVDRIQPRVADIQDKIERNRGEGTLAFMDLPYQEKNIINRIKDTAEELRGKIDNFVVLGIGGSALGSIALRSALKDSYYNLQGTTPRLFVPDNVDPERFLNLLAELDLSKTVFNVISKSGGTAETMSQFLIARKAVAEAVGEDNLADHFIATTSQDSGYLIEIVQKEDFKVFYIPEGVGGRFSVLTPVGLLFAAIAGMDIEELLDGAGYMDDICGNRDLWQNPAYLNAVLHYLAYQDGKKLSVMMPYAHSLRDVADWYRQLWAESLGKETDRKGNRINVGPTPVKALGATDQHSQVQLYMEGPYDKVITFMEVENYRVKVEIPGEYPEIEGVSYLGGHSLNKLIETEKKATELALTRRNRMNETLIVPEVNEFTIGQLFYLLELQTVVIGELFDINTFNQPGVELGKDYTYGILGRDGYQEKKEEFENRNPKNGDLII
ncbi:MAG: glucose-6-phosphate isomerase [Halanaerobiales bacterium]